MIKIKHGVDVDGLKNVMIEPLLFLHDLHTLCGVDLVITDAISIRPKKSLHPEGYAFDWRTRELNDTQVDTIFNLVTVRFNEAYDIVRYDTHGHIEYQRYLDDQFELDKDAFEKVLGYKIKMVA